MASSHMQHLVHFAQAILVLAAMALTVPRLFMDYEYKKKENLLALTAGAKSLVIIAYQMLTEHASRFKKWHSYKANVWLGCLEVVVWAAVAFFVLDTNISRCAGLDCTLSWTVFTLSVILSVSEVYTTAMAVRKLREYRAGRQPGKTAVQLEDSSSTFSSIHIYPKAGPY
ncbi:hypothetical protein C7974DRAFT_421051 [Boeremia exigua]|uniref:uncharacterized protein n=1 Tax=Boeremia exigua TaxID=749465 RepID=UPI001E8DF505|nr:uncharacterized protein C7974DRAFT_421051 [Boeremia exigua]KAH6642828.1 hypothetical protein C7974DRAFT_421051 [Boeremia exigua]